MTKPFDLNLYRNNDKITRDTIKRYIPELRDNPNIYDYDLMLDNHLYFRGVEVERINVWKNTNAMPFGNETRLFERKLKYGNDILFIQLSNNLKKCCIFSRKGVNENHFYTTSSGCRSYKVNKGACILIDTDKLNIKLIDYLQYLE